MSLRINTNLSSINAQRQLSTQQKRLEHAQAALASGKRIVSAGDDAAGLAISENFRAQIRSLSQAKGNALNAKSMIQVGEGGLNEISNILVRLKELGVQSSSDTIGDKEREFIDQEAKQLMAEVDRIAQSTRFGDKFLLNGQSNQLDFQVGAFSGDENVISYEIDADATADGLGLGSISYADKSDSKDTLETVDTAIEKVGKMRATFGAYQNRLEMTESNLAIQHENLSAARSRIIDADVAHETAELTSAQILQQASISTLANANQSTAAAMNLL